MSINPDIPILPPLYPREEMPGFSRLDKTETPKAPEDTVQKSDEKDWTVLYYMNGNNWMQKQMPGILRQLEAVGSDDKINYVAQISRQGAWSDKMVGDWNGARRYYVKENTDGGGILTTLKNSLLSGLPPYTKGIGSDLVEDLGRVDMGDPRNLKEFVEWGMKKYPARNYCVVLIGPSQGFYNVMKDEGTGSTMSAKELKDALSGAQKATGRKVDVLTLDLSSGSSVELGYQLKDQAKYIVGTPGVLAGDGLPLAMVNAEVKEAYKYGGLDAKEMAQTYTMVGAMSPTSAYYAPTISAIDTAKIENLKNSLDTLAQSLMDAKVPPEKLRKILYLTQELNLMGAHNVPNYEGVKDPYHFAELISRDKEIPDQKVKNACAAVMKSIDDAVVGEASASAAFSNSHGITAFLPTNYGFLRPDSLPVPVGFCRKFDYEFTDFGMDTAWPTLLEYMAKDSTSSNLAKKIGFSEETIDKAHGFVTSKEPALKSMSSLASTIGWWESYNVFSGKGPQPVFGIIPGRVAAAAGVWGGAWDTYNSLKAAVTYGKKYKNVDGVILSSFDVLRSACKGFANYSLLVPSLMPYGQMAGLVGFFGPWIKDVFTGWVNYKAIRDGVALGTGVESKSEAARIALDVHNKQNVVWDR